MWFVELHASTFFGVKKPATDDEEIYLYEKAKRSDMAVKSALVAQLQLKSGCSMRFADYCCSMLARRF